MIEWVKDKYLTWRTGMNREGRDLYKWMSEQCSARAPTIEDMFGNFKYVLPVSIKVFDLSHPFGWVPCEDFKQYLYPARLLGNNAVYYFARGYRSRQDGKFYLNDLYHEQDQVFVATNNEKDALMIALKYS